jgi:hypothetical protein
MSHQGAFPGLPGGGAGGWSGFVDSQAAADVQQRGESCLSA